ncbi:hypothetical protein [Deinococcus navajonensis]|uniref:Uncharacterized protein n=1 Tax=Deinococcus navajonensis TaxID=309884 RepID=A0ABV8XMV1_9DEIO
MSIYDCMVAPANWPADLATLRGQPDQALEWVRLTDLASARVEPASVQQLLEQHAGLRHVVQVD